MFICLPKSFFVLFLRFSLLLSITVRVLIGTSSDAKGDGLTCRSLISQVAPSLGHPRTLEKLLLALNAPFESNDPFFLLEKLSTDFRDFPSDPAVRAEHVSLGNNGEGYFLFRRIGDTWRSYSRPNPFAPNGDPTWVISALGPKVAAFFGFRLMSSDLMKHKPYRVLLAFGSRAAKKFGFRPLSFHFMYAPNSILFNRRIEAMNLLLKKNGFEEISVRWTKDFQSESSPEGVQYSYSERFVREFVFRDRSPFAPNEIVHDTSHHALEVALTQDQLAPIKARVGTLISFADFVRGLNLDNDLKTYPLLSNTRFREATIALLFQTQARAKDNLSGNMPFQVLDNPISRKNRSFWRTFGFHLGFEYGPMFSPTHEVPSKKPYTVADWFHSLIFTNLVPLIYNLSTGKLFDIGGLQLLRSYTDKAYGGAIGGLQHNTEKLRTELESLYKKFSDSELGGNLKSVLVEYDENLDVVGGLAAKEHPVLALERRIREFQIAIGE